MSLISNFWSLTPSSGKLLTKDIDDEKANKKIIKKIIEDKNKWENEILAEALIDFYPKYILDNDKGGISITINVNKVIFNGNKISIQQRDKDKSIITIYYKEDELKYFKLSELSKIVLIMINNKMKKVNPFKNYHYSDIKKYL